MIVTIAIPDKIASQMHLDGPDPHRHALEKLAVEGYRAGELSRGQISELLDLSFWETESLLKRHDCSIGGDITVDEHESEYEQARALFQR